VQWEQLYQATNPATVHGLSICAAHQRLKNYACGGSYMMKYKPSPMRIITIYLNFPLVLQKSPKKRGFDGKCSKYYLDLIFYWYA
jgi:hypothetical protein